MIDNWIYELMKNNKGLTSDDPIPYDTYVRIMFEKNKWYYSLFVGNVIKYTNTGDGWEWGSEIVKYNPLKDLYNKYKDDPKMAPQIMAKILGS